MICIDSLFTLGVEINRRLGKSAHLVSDLPGEEGTTELVAFAWRIGMRSAWIQKAGTEHEHFDVFEGRYQRALDAGAKVVTRLELVTIFRAKRAYAAQLKGDPR